MSAVTVAVAGGTGPLGRTMVDALAAAGFDVIVLARQGNSAAEKKVPGARAVVVADYADVSGLVALLERERVHTLVSTINTLFTADGELSLMRAAEASDVTRRYIPSVWGIKASEEISSFLPVIACKLNIHNALSQVSAQKLECTPVYCGYFADYYLDRAKVPSHFAPWSLAVDIPNRKAALPVRDETSGPDSERAISFNHTTDIARFVAALVSAPPGTWQEESWIATSKLRLSELISVVESVSPSRKFDVRYDTAAALAAGRITELPGHAHMYSPQFPREALQATFAGFERMIVEGVFDQSPPEGLKTLSEIFPEVKARTMRELLVESWRE